MGITVLYVVSVIQNAGRAPHIGDGELVCIHMLAEPLEMLFQEGCGKRNVVWCIAKIHVDGQDGIIVKHPFYDIVRRAYNIVVLVVIFQGREKFMVGLVLFVLHLHRLPCLLLVPGLEFRYYGRVNVVVPVVNLQNLAAATSTTRNKYHRQP